MPEQKDHFDFFEARFARGFDCLFDVLKIQRRVGIMSPLLGLLKIMAGLRAAQKYFHRFDATCS